MKDMDNKLYFHKGRRHFYRLGRAINKQRYAAVILQLSVWLPVKVYAAVNNPL